MNYGKIGEIARKHGAEVLYDESIAKYTTFNIGGVCDVIVFADSSPLVVELITECRKSDIKYYVFGHCSNVLISDDGLRGVVIIMTDSLKPLEREDCRIICGAGVSLTKVSHEAQRMGLSGMEFAFGIPGKVGGALYMNAGAYGREMKDVVKYCDYLDSDGTVKRMYVDEMQLSYRHSIFTGSDKVILSVCFELSPGDKDEINAKMTDLMQRRRDKQPLEFPSAGSTFKRPEGAFAAKLIEDSGLKGYTVGGAQVSEKHSGFVINRGGATCKDVKKIIEDIKEKVYADSGIKLECELITVE